jgi:hypothetical protein
VRWCPHCSLKIAMTKTELFENLRKQGANRERSAITTMVRRLIRVSSPVTKAMLQGLLKSIRDRD